MVELSEQLRQRMGVVVVGPAGSGKSTLWKTLKVALLKQGIDIKTHVFNPKAMGRAQLLGRVDLDTREWHDGVLTLSARQASSFSKINVFTFIFETIYETSKLNSACAAGNKRRAFYEFVDNL